MKRWLLISIPLAILTVLLFVKPPTFSSYKSNWAPTGTTNSTGSSSGVKPSVPGSGYGDESDGQGLVNGQKPAYGGHEADNYDPN